MLGCKNVFFFNIIFGQVMLSPTIASPTLIFMQSGASCYNNLVNVRGTRFNMPEGQMMNISHTWCNML
jgi:hypothetical protein